MTFLGGAELKRMKKTNPLLVQLIKDLKKVSWAEEAPIWRTIAKRLEKPLRNWAVVNIGKISKYGTKGEEIVIPGKLLATGNIDFPVTVASYSASVTAKEKIVMAGGKVVTISDLVKSNPKGTNVRIMG